MGQEVWAAQHYDPKIFKTDPGGIVYQREGNTPDWAFDMWHPWEKVQLMDFFDNREKLKAEFGEYYEKSLKKKWAPGSPETTTNTTTSRLFRTDTLTIVNNHLVKSAVVIV